MQVHGQLSGFVPPMCNCGELYPCRDVLLAEIERLNTLRVEEAASFAQQIEESEARLADCRELYLKAEGQLEKAVKTLDKVTKCHEALLTTLAPSKSSWLQHVVKNARAALKTLLEGP